LQQQTDASARASVVQSTSVDAPQLAATKAQTKRKAPTGTKAQPKRQKAIPSSRSQPTPLSQPDSADAPEQMIDPSDQGMPSAIVPDHINPSAQVHHRLSHFKNLLPINLQRNCH